VDAPNAHPFTAETLRRCWELAQGRCECQRRGHGHEGRCNRPLALHRHAFLGEGGWLALAWTSSAEGGADSPENCEVLCAPCYRATVDAEANAHTTE
jgi:hypothetical protein